jgi:hypothetical protein
MKTQNEILNLNGANLLEAVEKVIRQKNAQKFINTLNKKFTASQTSNLIKLLCDYEKFLNLND